MWKCPKCGSEKIDTFRMPYGAIWCEECKFGAEHKEIENPFVPKTHRMLDVGEKYLQGDEMLNPNTNIWEPIPQQWIDGGYEYSLTGTVGRFEIKMRRKLKAGAN